MTIVQATNVPTPAQALGKQLDQRAQANAQAGWEETLALPHDDWELACTWLYQAHGLSMGKGDAFSLNGESLTVHEQGRPPKEWKNPLMKRLASF